jgi:hypothetical protein
MGNLPARPIIAPYATIVVCSHVPVVLELRHPNFHKWAPFFKSLLGKFALHGHIVGTIPANRNDPHWVMDDAYVHNWLLGSVTPDVQELPIDGSQSACQLWVCNTPC